MSVANIKIKFLPIMNIVVCDGLRLDLPWTCDLATGKPLEVKLTADLQMQRVPRSDILLANISSQNACIHVCTN